MIFSRAAFCVLLLVLATACGPSLSDSADLHKRLVEKVSTDIPCVREFRVLFPDAKVGVYTKRFKTGTTSSQLTDVVYDRYELTLSCGFEVNPKTLDIISYETPTILLVEISSVEGSVEGPLKTTYATNYRISQKQWDKIVASGGQFSAAGVDVRTNEPVAGIEK